MELPVIDLTKIPTKFRKMVLSAQNILKSSYMLDRGETSAISLSMRMDYINLYHMHFGILSEKLPKDSTDLTASKSRFNLFGSIGIAQGAKPFVKSSDTKETIGLMSELSQVVLSVINDSFLIVSKTPRFSKPNKEVYESYKRAEHDFSLSVLKAYKLSLAYAKYSDESLMEKIVPYAVKIGIDVPEKTGLVVPDVGINGIKGMHIKFSFEKLMSDIRLLEYRMDYTKGFIDPDDKEYVDSMTNKYGEIGKFYLTYTKIYEKPDEVEMKV